MPFVGGLTGVSLSDGFGEDIRTGFFSNQLIKPYKIWITAFTREFAYKLQYLLAVGPVYILAIIGIFSFYYSSTINPTSIFLALLFVIFGFLFHIIFDLAISWCAFWTTDVWCFKHIKKIFFSVCGGRRFPIDFFSGSLLLAMEIMPFKFIYFIPLSYFLGIRKTQMVLIDTISVVTWSAFFASVGIILWKKGIKKYEAYGN